MEKPRLLIAEGSQDLVLVLEDLFQNAYQVRCCTDGDEAKVLLRQFQPDILILDLMLPCYDGLSLLQWSAEQDLRPVTLVTSRFFSTYSLDCLDRMGVSYLLKKPFDLGAAAARVEDMSRSLSSCQLRRPDPNSRVSDMLRALGVPTKLRGYAYLREAVVLMAEDPTQSITKVLYPEVAKRCSCAPMHVERSIRSAIAAAWNRRDDNLWRLYFYPDATGLVARPTNGEFVSRLADCLRTHSEVTQRQADAG